MGKCETKKKTKNVRQTFELSQTKKTFLKIFHASYVYHGWCIVVRSIHEGTGHYYVAADRLLLKSIEMIGINRRDVKA